MNQSPKNSRLHIGIFGRRNVGKSSLLNALTSQQVSIVSSVAGTTTDPVEKPMELLPLGPVLFIDTAGIDDVGSLGELRTAKTFQTFDRTDLGMIVTSDGVWGEFEKMILDELRNRKVPVIIVFNKVDLDDSTSYTFDMDINIKRIAVSALTGLGMQELRQLLIASAPDDFVNQPPLVSDLVPAGSYAVLVVPIDKEAPKGRLILP